MKEAIARFKAAHDDYQAHGRQHGYIKDDKPAPKKKAEEPATAEPTKVTSSLPKPKGNALYDDGDGDEKGRDKDKDGDGKPAPGGHHSHHQPRHDHGAFKKGKPKGYVSGGCVSPESAMPRAPAAASSNGGNVLLD